LTVDIERRNARTNQLHNSPAEDEENLAVERLVGRNGWLVVFMANFSDPQRATAKLYDPPVGESDLGSAESTTFILPDDEDEFVEEAVASAQKSTAASAASRKTARDARKAKIAKLEKLGLVDHIKDIAAALKSDGLDARVERWKDFVKVTSYSGQDGHSWGMFKIFSPTEHNDSGSIRVEVSGDPYGAVRHLNALAKAAKPYISPKKKEELTGLKNDMASAIDELSGPTQ